MTCRTIHAKLIGSVIGLLLLVACQPHPAAWSTANMTPKSARVETVLSKLVPHCFGRFMIDLPQGTTVAWGGALDLKIAPGRGAEVNALVAAMEQERKKEARYPLTDHLNLYFETRNGDLAEIKHVVSQRDFASENFIRIDTYFSVGNSLVTTQSETMTGYVDKAIAEIEDVARRLRPRREDEIPTDAGQCIENGFVADRPTAGDGQKHDFINVGYRLQGLSDVHLSIDLQPANEEWAKPGLRKRLQDSEAEARRHGDMNLYGDLTTFRRAPRPIGDWKDGYEFLTKVPDHGQNKAYHDFWMIFAGQIDNLYHPYADIRMSSGVSENTSGTVQPSITDDEAIALWDALTSTIRVRPVTAKAAEATPEVPIGTLAATGRACPRTGVWRCADESLRVQGGREQRFHVGETMPSAVLLGEPSLLQRLRGETPTHASPTVWKLVSVDTPGAAP